MSRRTGWEPQRADMHAGTKQEWERRPGWCTYQRVRRTGIVDKSARSTVFTDSASWENLGDVGIQQDSDRPRMRHNWQTGSDWLTSSRTDTRSEVRQTGWSSG
jgi:hypothetical protein